MILFMIMSLKVLEFDQSEIGTNTVKSPQSFFLNLDQNQICKVIFEKK